MQRIAWLGITVEDTQLVQLSEGGDGCLSDAYATRARRLAVALTVIPSDLEEQTTRSAW